MLADVFPDAAQVRALGLDQASDEAIWDYAAREGFVIVTLDADFADLAALHSAPPKVIWLRCGNQPTALVEQLLRERAG
jgi:predicted nuclease of predicted toxin-antitoxin system